MDSTIRTLLTEAGQWLQARIGEGYTVVVGNDGIAIVRKDGSTQAVTPTVYSPLPDEHYRPQFVQGMSYHPAGMWQQIAMAFLAQYAMPPVNPHVQQFIASAMDSPTTVVQPDVPVQDVVVPTAVSAGVSAPPTNVPAVVPATNARWSDIATEPVKQIIKITPGIVPGGIEVTSRQKKLAAAVRTERGERSERSDQRSERSERSDQRSERSVLTLPPGHVTGPKLGVKGETRPVCVVAHTLSECMEGNIQNCVDCYGKVICDRGCNGICSRAFHRNAASVLPRDPSECSHEMLTSMFNADFCDSGSKSTIHGCTDSKCTRNHHITFIGNNADLKELKLKSNEAHVGDRIPRVRTRGKRGGKGRNKGGRESPINERGEKPGNVQAVIVHIKASAGVTAEEIANEIRGTSPEAPRTESRKSPQFTIMKRSVEGVPKDIAPK